MEMKKKSWLNSGCQCFCKITFHFHLTRMAWGLESGGGWEGCTGLWPEVAEESVLVSEHGHLCYARDIIELCDLWV